MRDIGARARICTAVRGRDSGASAGVMQHLICLREIRGARERYVFICAFGRWMGKVRSDRLHDRQCVRLIRTGYRGVFFLVG